MKLGTYKHLKVNGPDTTIPEAQLQRSITNLQKKNALFYHVDDRGANLEDVVVLNYEGFINGESFLGGKAHHHRLTLGAGKMVPGFEEQIIGHMVGDTFDIHVTFPENYANKEVAGKDAIFRAELVFMGYEEIPAFDDDFALDFSSFSTAKEFEESLLTNLASKKSAEEQERIQQDLLTLIIDGSDIPKNEELIAQIQEEYFEDRLYDIELQGMSFEDYLLRSHQTEEDILNQCYKKALREYEQTAILHAIAQEEDLCVSDEDLFQAIYQMVDFDEEAAVDTFENLSDDQRVSLELQLLCDQAMALILEHAEFI